MLKAMEHPAYSQLRPVTPSAGVVLCPNPGYSSLEGTNSWVVRAEGDRCSIVIDPGPADEGHLNVLHGKAETVGLILLTHRHHDHADGAERFRQLTGAGIRAQQAPYCHGGEVLRDGEIIAIDGVTPQLEVVFTPGHTSDSVCFFVWSGVPHESTLEGIITGDTIAGRHTTMISETDGDDVASFAHWYIERRMQRLDQIKEAIAQRGADVPIKELIDAVYDDVDPVLRGAAEQSTRVALRYLAQQQ